RETHSAQYTGIRSIISSPVKLSRGKSSRVDTAGLLCDATQASLHGRLLQRGEWPGGTVGALVDYSMFSPRWITLFRPIGSDEGCLPRGGRAAILNAMTVFDFANRKPLGDSCEFAEMNRVIAGRLGIESPG